MFGFINFRYIIAMIGVMLTMVTLIRGDWDSPFPASLRVILAGSVCVRLMYASSFVGLSRSRSSPHIAPPPISCGYLGRLK